MYINEDLNKYVKLAGDRFRAVTLVAKIARQLRKSVGYVISESEALDWVLTGNQPDKAKQYKSGELRRNKKSSAYDRLNYVADQEVIDAVVDSCECSKHNHLVYRYNNIVEPSRQARVRILTNTVVDELHTEELEKYSLYNIRRK